ncbi:hypothetical protein AURDEDRAFT_168185 [Auricularia subglabra TFB-10046 SS5]|nr:hypothetical protein AURDEDRAFT_168185 [Auricularia subglabra TFB-10046 SS5]
MRTTVFMLSAAALVAPAVALQNSVNGGIPVSGGAMSNKLGVAERATPDYGAAAPPPYAAPDHESASSNAATETGVHKRLEPPGLPVSVPTPAAVRPTASHVIPSPPAQTPTPPVQPPVQPPAPPAGTSPGVQPPAPPASTPPVQPAAGTPMRVGHAVMPHKVNVGRRALEIATDAGREVVSRARELITTRPAGVKREVLNAIRDALADLDKLGVPSSSGPQNDALAAGKHVSNSHEDEKVNMRGVDVTHNLDPLSTKDESVPEEEQEADPTYSSNV